MQLTPKDVSPNRRRVFARLYYVGYTERKFEIRETDTYQRWFESLRDLSAQLRIAARIRRVSLGNLGDVKSVGDGVLELRVMYGPGFVSTSRGMARP